MGLLCCAQPSPGERQLRHRRRIVVQFSGKLLLLFLYKRRGSFSRGDVP